MGVRTHRRTIIYRLAFAVPGLVVLAGCGGGETGSDEALSTVSVQTSERSVVFDVPDGWQLGADGLTVAESSADLDRPVPTGPRVRLVEGDNATLTDTTEGTELSELVEGPVLDIDVAGHRAVAITLRDSHDSSELMRRYVLVDVDGSPRLFVLEAPADQWGGAVDQLGEIIGIDPAGYAAALAGDRDGDGRSDTEEMAVGQDPDVFTSQACFDLVDAQANPAVALTLSGIDLSGVDLSGCSLIGANLTAAELGSADLTGANLTMADLTDADLTGASLARSVLVAANLTGANLTDAAVVDANFIGADLTGSTPPSSWQSTTCPDGTLSSEHQDTCQP